MAGGAHGAGLRRARQTTLQEREEITLLDSVQKAVEVQQSVRAAITAVRKWK